MGGCGVDLVDQAGMGLVDPLGDGVDLFWGGVGEPVGEVDGRAEQVGGWGAHAAAPSAWHRGWIRAVCHLGARTGSMGCLQTEHRIVLTALTALTRSPFALVATFSRPSAPPLTPADRTTGVSAVSAP